MPQASKRQALETYARLPLSFIRNAGQVGPRIRYYALGSGYSFAFTRKEAVLAFSHKKQGLTLGLRFVGASPKGQLKGEQRLPERVNYLLGNDAAKWHTGLATYRRVVYRDLWPAIDMVFGGRNGRLTYEFLVRPGARPQKIQLAYRGAQALSLDRRGTLRIRTSLGVLTDERPLSYQLVGGKRVPVASRFALRPAAHYGFALGSYDPRRPLVIDPGLVYSTFLGGSDTDAGLAIALDTFGDAYVTGETGGAFPTTPGAFETSPNGTFDAFVTKLNPLGTGLVYSTYLGGDDFDSGRGIAVDSAGNAYVSGVTRSANFPTTPGAYDTSANGTYDAFVTKLDALGTTPLYSTYLGGSAADFGNGIALDAAGDAHVTGFTQSADFPTTPGAFDTSFNGSFDVFVTELNPAGTSQVYSTYLGGSDTDTGIGISLDGAGEAYVTGYTLSAGFPTTPGAFDTSLSGSADAFVTKLNPLGTDLVYSTYLGGTAFDEGYGIAVDAAGDAYLTGQTRSASFPTTAGAFDTSFNGFDDVFVTRLNPLGTGLVYSTYLGGSSTDVGSGIALDAAGAASLTGETRSTDFPTTAGAYDTSANGSLDGFVTKLNPLGTSLLYSTYLGGSSDDEGRGIALDAAGHAYVTGSTLSAGFPTTPAAVDTSFNGNEDAFVAKLDLIPGPPATLMLSPKAATNTVGTTHCVTATVTDASGNPVPGVTVRFSVPTAVATHASPSSSSATTDANGQASFCYSASLPGEDAIHAFADTNNNGTQDGGEPFDDASKTWTPPASTALCEVTITNGAWIIADNGDRANFGGDAKVAPDGSSVQGQEQYQDQGPVQPLNVHSIQLTATTCSDDLKSATIYGKATIDGSGDHVFRIDVTDMGSPGTNDSYGIILDTGYLSGQKQLQGGNVTIHK